MHQIGVNYTKNLVKNLIYVIPCFKGGTVDLLLRDNKLRHLYLVNCVTYV